MKVLLAFWLSLMIFIGVLTWVVGLIIGFWTAVLLTFLVLFWVYIITNQRRNGHS